MKPTRKNILVAENAAENKSASGLIIDSKSYGDSKTGTVLAIGPEVTMVSIGDKILLDWRSVQVVTVDGAQRVILSEDNVVAIVD